MDRLTAAEVFLDVARTGSFTATADRLEMSRPMVTRHVEAMESWLGARLFHRTTRKVNLTGAGARCLAEVERWLNGAQRLRNAVQTDGELSDAVRLSVSTSFGIAQLMPALTEFLAVHPRVEIDVDLQDASSDLIDDRIDLALRIASTPDLSLIGKPIALCKSVLVASPGYLSNHPPISEPTDLSEHACLGYRNFERHVWHLSRGERHEAVKVTCRLTANEATALSQAAIEGAGIALQPSYLVNRQLEQGSLKAVLGDWELPTMSLYALYSSRKHLLPTVRALIDFLESYFRRNAWD